MNLTALPILFVDMAGSLVMIVFSFLSLKQIRALNRQEPGSIIWTYLLWVCYFLAGFAVSRSAGHILKQLLIISDDREIWSIIQPYSGTINTVMLILVASATLFFERVWQVYEDMQNDRRALQSAHKNLMELNETLECRVQERTEALAMSEKQISQADRLASIGQLSSGIAHEINNPLGIILGYTQLMIRSEPTDTQRYDDLKTIEKHVKHCKIIVEDLLNFARTSKPRQESMNIHEALDDALAFIRHQSGSDRMEIVREYDPNVPPMVLDEKKIKQVLINLMMNAIHAVRKKGRITLRTRFDAQENNVLITIKDTGYGIEKKNLSRIFDPFFTTKPTGEGTGLGLAVSYGIIKSHGGDIRVASEIGNGAEFTVVLPAGKPGAGRGDG
ncbi:MAG: GHKL domain-containing protein [Desulfobacteraceae bacterium]|nr:MAG: GHKL domain-containing protein [Desulfobacteraceae bacterium]